jgi:hypothetical protein
MNKNLTNDKRIFSTEIVIKSVVLAPDEQTAARETMKNYFQLVPLDTILSFDVEEKVHLASYDEVKPSIVKVPDHESP